MVSVEFRGDRGDLERFARDALSRTVTFDEPSPFERRMRWDIGGKSGFSSSTRFRSGIALSTTKLRWEQPWAFQFGEAAAPLKFLLSRGDGPRMTLRGGRDYVLGRGVMQVKHSSRATGGTCEFDRPGGECENVALELAPERLRELLGTPELPLPLQRLFTESAPTAMHEQPIAPSVSRLLDEIVHCDARGASRPLFLEAKTLELLALLVDEVEHQNPSSPFGQRDLERFERARRLLLERMVDPPSLPELARLVGLNEAKLKAGFRAVFGTSAYAYLRVQRMEAARRLLLQRDLNVTEVAARVGYANPSKFATVFRKQFGAPPSARR